MEQEIWDLMNNLLKEDNIINGNQHGLIGKTHFWTCLYADQEKLSLNLYEDDADDLVLFL